MRDTVYKNTCPFCGVRRPNIPLHLRRYHPDYYRAVHKGPQTISIKRGLTTKQQKELRQFYDELLSTENDRPDVIELFTELVEILLEDNK